MNVQLGGLRIQEAVKLGGIRIPNVNIGGGMGGYDIGYEDGYNAGIDEYSVEKIVLEEMLNTIMPADVDVAAEIETELKEEENGGES